jgi:hypothetical protein
VGKRSAFERIANDFYPTPLKAALPLVPHLNGIRTFAEPCCGDGALVKHLESFGLRCTYAGDIATGQDALAKAAFDSPIITNPPWTRRVLHQLIVHFMNCAPFSWLLFDADWAHTRQSIPFIPHCSLILPLGRVKWIPNSPYDSGKDNAAWYRFDRYHRSGPVLLPYRANSAAANSAHACRQCSAPYTARRSDSRFCSDTCRQRAHREKVKRDTGVTPVSPAKATHPTSPARRLTILPMIGLRSCASIDMAENVAREDGDA